ncbi:MAG: Stp1/IreP family PP2C-type Ser/Thr phosphatase [Oscillochloris sp.]|nr:Stp1/IreP family PP2C-type Ser/Thr phosphatase [Oscillochloris sp.]
MRVRYSARTDVGLRREVNQDYHGAVQNEHGTLLVVCDGMGGHAAGEVASQLGVETILADFPLDADPNEVLPAAFHQANERIYEQGRGSMGTTGVAALLRRSAVYVANVGDSRAYLVREGHIQQISHDHSFVSDQVAAGLMTPEQARHSNIRNIITRALGHQSTVNVDLFARRVRPGDTLLLSSDGMHGLIEDAEIAEITSMLPPEQAAERLVVLANERGGIDNITVIIAQIDEVDPPLEGDPEDEGPPVDEQPDADESPVARPATPAATPPVERPLSQLGLLLSTLTLVVLLGVGGWLLWVPPPAHSPAATAAPVPSPVTTVAPQNTPSSTPRPTPAPVITLTP